MYGISLNILPTESHGPAARQVVRFQAASPSLIQSLEARCHGEGAAHHSLGDVCGLR